MGNWMLSILRDNTWDVEDGSVYFETTDEARKKGVEIVNKEGREAFCVRKIFRGHYRTFGYFNKNNEFIR